MDDKTTYAPLVLFEYDHDPGNYCLMLSDSKMVEVIDVFQANGREGGGYAWTDVAVQAIRTHSPELESKMGFDPEAGTFVAYGEDLEALKELGKLLSDAFADEAKLGELVAAAPWEWD